MERRRVRGGSRLIQLADSLGLLDRVVSYPLGAGVRLQVPLFRADNRWDLDDVRHYERALVSQLARVVAELPGPPAARLLDCGADIGLFTLLLLSRGLTLGAVEAFEPNPAAYPYLARNLEQLRIPARAHRVAISNFAGRGRLAASPTDSSDHARFLEHDEESGTIPVMRIDDLGLPAGEKLVIKIDVEGGELAALEGARATIERAASFAVTLEAHRDAVARTGIDPGEFVRLLAAIRPVAVAVAERPDVRIDPGKLYFEQVTWPPVTNLLVHSRL